MKAGDICPGCGLVLPTVAAFRQHMLAIADDDDHAAALWTLPGIDYTRLMAQSRADDLAEERGWTIIRPDE